tara:strand:- start:64 stop:393 length:330 start_codon:yes stop_codon:yes gene_type:complete
MTEILRLLEALGLDTSRRRGPRVGDELSQAQVGMLLGLVPSTLGRYVRGERSASGSVVRLARLIVWLKREHPEIAEAAEAAMDHVHAGRTTYPRPSALGRGDAPSGGRL